MIKNKRLPENIELLLPKAYSYLYSQPDIIFGYLFGGLARREDLSLSDVDIAVYLSEKADFAAKKMELLGRLMDLLQTDEIDLVILNTAPVPLKMRVLQNKKIIVDHDPFLRNCYESLTMRVYFDFSIKEKGILERRFLNG